MTVVGFLVWGCGYLLLKRSKTPLKWPRTLRGLARGFIFLGCLVMLLAVGLGLFAKSQKTAPPPLVAATPRPAVTQQSLADTPPLAPNKTPGIVTAERAAQEQKQNIIDTSKAVEYKVISEENISFLGRERWRIFILASRHDLTVEERAHTAMKAAMDLLHKKHAHLASSTLYADRKGDKGALAVADYSPDGGGVSGKDGWIWNVEVSPLIGPAPFYAPREYLKIPLR